MPRPARRIGTMTNCVSTRTAGAPDTTGVSTVVAVTGCHGMPRTRGTARSRPRGARNRRWRSPCRESGGPCPDDGCWMMSGVGTRSLYAVRDPREGRQRFYSVPRSTKDDRRLPGTMARCQIPSYLAPERTRRPRLTLSRVLSTYPGPRAQVSSDSTLPWWRRILPIIASHRVSFVAAIVLSFASLIFQTLVPNMLNNTITNVLQKHSGSLRRAVIEIAIVGVVAASRASCHDSSSIAPPTRSRPTCVH